MSAGPEGTPGMPGHLYTAPGVRRGKIGDMNAFLRMKRHLTVTLGLADIWEQHTLSKALYEDDTLVIHNRKVLYPIDPAVMRELSRLVIEYQAPVQRNVWTKEDAVSFVLIPIDQAACPSGKRIQGRQIAAYE